MNQYRRFRLLLIPLFLLAAANASDWPTFRGNQQRTGYSCEDVGIPMSGYMWRDSLGCGIVSSPAIVDDVLYIGARDSCLYAIEVGTGNILWKQKTRGWIDSSPLIYKGMVIVGSRDNSIYVFDKQTGDSLSAMCAGLQLSSPGLMESGLIISGMGPPSNGFAAYQWNIANEKWQIRFQQMSYSSPSVLGTRSVIGASDGMLYGINLSQKDTSWALRTGGGIYLSTPAIEDSIVYFAPGNYDRNIYAAHLQDGRLLWKSRGSLTIGKVKRIENEIHPALWMKLLRLGPDYRDRVIQKLLDRKIAIPKALAGTNTEDVMQAGTSGFFYAYGDMKTSSVAVGPKNVYVIQKELGYPKTRFTLLALDRSSGEEIWRFNELRNSEKLGYCSSPIVANGKVFFGWGEGRIYALDSKTGEKLWEDSLQGHVISSPAIANGKLYIATYEGYLYAYDLQDTPQPQNFNEGTFCYPNPAKTLSKIQYFIQKPGKIEVRIYDTAERLVKIFRKTNVAANAKGQFIWDISSAANGIYFAIVKVMYDDGTKDQKILKIAVLK